MKLKFAPAQRGRRFTQIRTIIAGSHNQEPEQVYIILTIKNKFYEVISNVCFTFYYRLFK